MNNAKVFVGNLAFSTTQNDLQDMFGAHGPVVDVKIPIDRDTGKPRGFAFVTMETADAAKAAIHALNGRSVGERTLTVNEAKPREERPAFNRSGVDSRRDNSRGERY